MGRNGRRNQSSDKAIDVEFDDKVMENAVVTGIAIGKNCQHVARSVDLSNVKKAITKNHTFESLTCSNCPDQGEGQLSLCLKCGSCNCEKHAREHFLKPHSDPHNLSIQIGSFYVWCFKCECEVPLDSAGKLNCCAAFVKKKFEDQSPQESLLLNGSASDLEDSMASLSLFNNRDNLVTTKYTETLNLNKVRGLTNLGNTCFFNSVLQCLAQTPFLLETLKELSAPGRRVQINIDENNSINVELDGWGPVTEALADCLEQMTNGSLHTMSPSSLLDALRKKCSRFLGYQQQDSHELLRQLLDTVKTEDIRRYQIHILSHVGLKKSTNPSEVDEKKRNSVKQLNQKLAEVVTILPDPVFKGSLVSTVQCTKCYHKSEVSENFLDLSLPVSFDKPQPPMMARKKSGPSRDGMEPKSKHQMKKEAKAARKKGSNTRRNRDHNNSGGKCASNNNVAGSVEGPALLEAVSKLSKELGESGYCSEKTEVAFPSMKDEEREEGEWSYGKGGNMGDLSGHVNDIVDGSIEDLTVKELSGESLKPPRTNLHQNSSNSATSGSEVDDEVEEEVADAGDDDGEDSAADGDRASTSNGSFDWQENPEARGTLQPSLYGCPENECSIASCLSQFTALEILTGNNKVCCESCTEKQNKGSLGEKGKKKPVYQPSTKRLLISSPPPVLILHLKRFQAMCYSFRKNLLAPGQNKVLYSLYGIVEHSGSLHAGHYVAYVKVRPELDKNHYRRLFLTRGINMQNILPVLEDLLEKALEDGRKESRWYYISDSFVTKVPEESVLQKEAYLLFYERIY